MYSIDLNGSFDLFAEGDNETKDLEGLSHNENIEGNNGTSETTSLNINGNSNIVEAQTDCEQSDRHVPSISTNSKIGSKKPCPLCQKSVKYLSLHLRHHPLTKTEVKDLCYKQRKRRQSKFDEKLLKLCPIPECKDLPFHPRLDKHLQRKHHLKRGDLIYDRCVLKKSYISLKNRSDKNSTYKLVETDKTIENECQTFCAHLHERLGGKLSSYNARQHSYKLRQILYGVNFAGTDDLIAYGFIDKLQKYLDIFSQSHCGTSVVTYLSVLVTYLCSLKTRKILPSDSINDLLDLIKPIKKSFRKEAPSTLHELDEEVTEEEIRTFEASECYKNSISLIKSFGKGMRNSISTHEHSMCRGILLIMAILRNGSRSCNLANMTVQELSKAKEEMDSYGKADYVISVHEHKTYTVHKEADVTLDKFTFNLFKIYMNNIRSIFLKNGAIDHNYVFVTWSGKKISSDDLLKSINGPWCTAGLMKKITTTMFRKTLTTRIHSENDARKKVQLAEHLRHHPSTAEAFYKYKNKPARSVAAAKLIRATLGGVWKDYDDNGENEIFGPSDDETGFDFVANQSSSRFTPELVPKPSLRTDTPYKRPKGRSFYSDKERDILKYVFAEFIQKCQVPALAKIREIVAKDFRCAHLSDEKLDPVKVKGAIQNFINKEKKKRLSLMLII